jgi:hypothetical protein
MLAPERPPGLGLNFVGEALGAVNGTIEALSQAVSGLTRGGEAAADM